TVRLRRPDGTDAVTLTSEDPSGTLQAASATVSVMLRTDPPPFALHRPSPNPVRRRAELEYAVPRSTPVRIAVYDVLGRRVTTLVDGARPPGTHRVSIDASSLTSGVYFVRMQSGDFTQTRRMTVVR
ncbi:MAG: T9SS type A sorting domain-containing protein, partial [Salinibacter sp.]